MTFTGAYLHLGARGVEKKADFKLTIAYNEGLGDGFGELTVRGFVDVDDHSPFAEIEERGRQQAIERLESALTFLKQGTIPELEAIGATNLAKQEQEQVEELKRKIGADFSLP